MKQPFEPPKMPLEQPLMGVDTQDRNRILNLFTSDGETYLHKRGALLDFTRPYVLEEEWSKEKTRSLRKNAGYLKMEEKVTRRLLREGEFFLLCGQDFKTFLYVYNYLAENPDEQIFFSYDPLDFLDPDCETLSEKFSEKFREIELKALCDGSSTPFSDENEIGAFNFEPLVFYWDAVCLFLKMQNDPRNSISLEDIEKGKYFRLYGKADGELEVLFGLEPFIENRNRMIFNFFTSDGEEYYKKKKALLWFTLSYVLDVLDEKWSKEKTQSVKKNAGCLKTEEKVTRRLLREGEFFLLCGQDFKTFLYVYNILPENPGEHISFSSDPTNFLNPAVSEKFYEIELKALLDKSSTLFSDENEIGAFRSEPLVLYWDAVCLFLKMQNDPRNSISLEDIEKGKYFRLYGKADGEQEVLFGLEEPSIETIKRMIVNLFTNDGEKY